MTPRLESSIDEAGSVSETRRGDDREPVVPLEPRAPLRSICRAKGKNASFADLGGAGVPLSREEREIPMVGCYFAFFAGSIVSRLVSVCWLPSAAVATTVSLVFRVLFTLLLR